MYDDELKYYSACNYGKSFGFIIQRASVLASTENTWFFTRALPRGKQLWFTGINTALTGTSGKTHPYPKGK